MAYVKKYATDEERRKAAAAAGRKGAAALKASGNFKGGRPKGSPNKNPSSAIPTRSISVREPDYKIFSKAAASDGKTVVDFMHRLAEFIKSKNPKLFGEEPTVEL